MSKLVINKKQGIYIMSLDDIVYMEKALRKIVVYSMDASIEFYGKFADIAQYLDRRFMSCHRSYMINMDKIVVMAGNKIFFENNEHISLGNDTYGRARRLLTEYLAEKRAERTCETSKKVKKSG